MKIYAPSDSRNQIGGGWTFHRNLKNGLKNKVHFVDSWQECDVFLISGVTIVDKNTVFEAKKAGKKIVFRVDNVPKKSRNKRSTPHERMKEFSDLADVVVYQSKWAEEYCYPLCGTGNVVYNGVDTKVFKNKNIVSQSEKENRYCFVYHGNNETKQFWLAHYIFQRIFRENSNAEFYFIYDFKRDLPELENSNFDFWNGEKYKHFSVIDNEQDLVDFYNKCGTIIYPAFADACPNTVLEAMACGLNVIGYPDYDVSSTKELVENGIDISLERMCEEYLGIFTLLTNEQVFI